MPGDYYATLEKAGLSRIRFHDLRHTAASILISHETPINVVSSMLGHSKPSVTLDIYAHVYSGRQEQAAALMDELVTPMAVDFNTEDVKAVRFTAKDAVTHEKAKPASKAGLCPPMGCDAHFDRHI